MGVYEFRQNNSGGSFTEPALYIFVEAETVELANRGAEAAGAYFGGVGDCECCGDRWFEAGGRPDFATVEEAIEAIRATYLWDGDEEYVREAGALYVVAKVVPPDQIDVHEPVKTLPPPRELDPGEGRWGQGGPGSDDYMSFGT